MVCNHFGVLSTPFFTVYSIWKWRSADLFAVRETALETYIRRAYTVDLREYTAGLHGRHGDLQDVADLYIAKNAIV